METKTERIEIEEDISDEPDRIEGIHAIKKEKPDIEVIYQSLPWETELESNQQFAINTPFEVDRNPIIKSEIEIDEPMLLNETEVEKTNIIIGSRLTTVDSVGVKEKIRKRNKQKSSQIKQLQCKFCNKKFSQQEGLDKHTYQHPKELPFQCGVCMQRFIKMDRMKEHESKCTIRRFECYVCGFTSLHAHWNRFMVHFRKHTGDQPFSCVSCAKRFANKRMLNWHMKYHPKEIPLKCSFCQRKFPNDVDAKNHEADCALRRRMECYICKSSFTYISSLKRHMPQHTGLTRFNCDFCKKGYVRKEYLDMHLKTHSNELPFGCILCKSRFSEQSQVDRHMALCKRKQLFTCTLCDYSTVSKIYAEDHKQKHIGADEFKCLHCPKVFLQRSKLVHHVKSHNKKVIFHCPHCQKAYHRWVCMENHRKSCSRAMNSNI